MSGAFVGIGATAQLRTFSQLSLVAGASLGAAGVMLIVLSLSRRVSAVTLLILSLMLGFMSEGVVSLLLHFTTESQAKLFGSWNDGNYGGVTWNQVTLLAPLVVVSLTCAVALGKALNALLLGDHHAKALGVEVRLTRFVVLTLTTVTAGGVTAYCGPIAFLDLVVPHLCRGAFRTSDHRVLIPAVILMGAVGCAAGRRDTERMDGPATASVAHHQRVRGRRPAPDRGGTLGARLLGRRNSGSGMGHSASGWRTAV